MKRSMFPVAALLVLASAASAQVYDLIIHLADGQTVTIPAEEFRRLEFVLGASGVDDGSTPSATPQLLRLLRAYPNPFNPLTTIEYEIPQEAAVFVGIFDLHGARIAELQNGVQVVGRHLVTWDGTDGSGARVASGIYLCTVQSGGQALSRQLVPVK